MNLARIQFYRWNVDILYELLRERQPHQNISHKELPTFNEHREFIYSNPYKDWRLILVNNDCVGSIYLTEKNEIGVHIFNKHQGMGYGSEAVKELMRNYKGPFYANINPKNEGSIRLFKKLGFKHIQNTYKLEADNEDDN